MPDTPIYIPDGVLANPLDADDVIRVDRSGKTMYTRVEEFASDPAFTDQFAPLAYARSGSGAPNGVVTGNVGDRYVDTAATLGAVVWYKASGMATNTGWAVAEGDTGWRDISSLLINGWTLDSGVTGLFLRRVGSVVEVYANNGGGINGSAKTNAVAVATISGFTSASTVRRAAVVGNFRSNASGLIASDATGGVIISGVWTTTDAWPASLPGT